ncbi:hypothetical protein PPL_03173 [Heterostelium album PN500]|uniref:Uncharacterized protein n=1 Tax=Heterostelium pallidum (strain ATCC 26659 / Pp 5 / PN500) TaxID=670386 RepID=D3B452_HETP5|nr:hypothetical protein PPL_03173 [Heterostelium album PN500]EFA84100.1 hypothetical protein PPL_03173 [Heterostelium album PN500]|eukprot:XP_020436217.1 hypothetical protein PPL_03173 [Heterostelium album PN500]
MSLKRKSNNTNDISSSSAETFESSISNFKIRKEDFKLDFDDEIMTPKKILIQGFNGGIRQQQQQQQQQSSFGHLSNQENRRVGATTPKRKSVNNLLSEFSNNSAPLSPLNLENINNIASPTFKSSSSSSLSSSPYEKKLQDGFAVPAPVNPAITKLKQKELLASLSQLQSPKTKPVVISSPTTIPTTTTPTATAVKNTTNSSTPSKLKTPIKSLNTFASPSLKRSNTPTNVIIPLSNMTVSSPKKLQVDEECNDSPSPPSNDPVTVRKSPSPTRTKSPSKKTNMINKRIKDIKQCETTIKSDVHPSKVISGSKMLTKHQQQPSASTKPTAKTTTTTIPRMKSSLSNSSIATPIKSVSSGSNSTTTTPIKSISTPITSLTPLKRQNETITTLVSSSSSIGNKSVSTPIVKKIKPTITTTPTTITTPVSSKFKSVSMETSATKRPMPTTTTPVSISKRDLTLSSSRKQSKRPVETSANDDIDFESRIESALIAAAQGTIISGSLLLSSPERAKLEQQQLEQKSKWSPIKRNKQI